jgi:hypothetical protein
MVSSHAVKVLFSHMGILPVAVLYSIRENNSGTVHIAKGCRIMISSHRVIDPLFPF